MDTRRRLEGSVPLAALVRAEPDAPLIQLVKHETPRLSPRSDFDEVARVMADYNLTSAPVVDEHEWCARAPLPPARWRGDTCR